MPQARNVDIKIKLGELAHADVAQPGRRLVCDRERGWLSLPARRRFSARVPNRTVLARLSLVAGPAALVLLVAWVLRQAPMTALDAGGAHPPIPSLHADASALESASRAQPAGGPDVQVIASPAPASAPWRGTHLSSQALASLEGPRPEWASLAKGPPGNASMPPNEMVSSSKARRPPHAAASPMEASAVVRAPEKLMRGSMHSRSMRSGQAVAHAASPPSRARHTALGPPGPPGLPDPAGSSPPTTHTVFSAPATRTVRQDLLVAITDANTIVVPDTGGLPAPFRLGERLPSGARLLRIDLGGGEAETDRGVIRLE